MIRLVFEREEIRDLLKAVMKKRGQPPGKISCYSTDMAPQQEGLSDSLRTMAQTNMVQGLIKGSVLLSSWSNDWTLVHIERVCVGARNMLWPHIWQLLDSAAEQFSWLNILY